MALLLPSNETGGYFSKSFAGRKGLCAKKRLAHGQVGLSLERLVVALVKMWSDLSAVN